MNQLAVKALVGAVVLSLSTMCWAQTPEQTLDRWRALVRAKQYDAALDEYEKIAQWLWRDPGLVTERARVYSYANRHQEAIELLEEVRQKHPEQAKLFEGELENQYAYIILQRAQDLVEQERYDDALRGYEKISEWMQRDPELTIELARVHVYADNHVEAIALFEQVLQRYPSYEKEIITQLADQYVWNKQRVEAMALFRHALEQEPGNVKYRLRFGKALTRFKQYDQAIAEYNVILGEYPQSVPAMLGKAEALSWQDYLEEADELYEQVREIDPGNLEAMNGQARILVWKGYHRRGETAYREILETHPEDYDALEGLGFALHWDNRQREAVDVFERLYELRPGRREASDLMYEIKYAQNPYIEQFNDYSRNSDGRRIQSHGAIVGVPLNYETLLEGIYQYQRIWDNDDGNVNSHRGGLGIHHRFSNHLKIDSYLYGTYFDRGNWEEFTTDTKLTWSPDDIWRFKGSYERDTFSDVEAILKKIVVDSWSASVGYRPNRFWLLGGKFKQGFYSDDNRQESVLAILERRLSHKPFLKVYYNFYFSNWDKQLGNGYFNPKRFWSHTVGLYGSRKISPQLFLEGQISGGYESHTPPTYSPTMFAAAGLKYLPTEKWAIRLRGEYFKAWSDRERVSNGYHNAQVTLSVTYSLGPETPEPQKDRPPIFAPAREPRPDRR